MINRIFPGGQAPLTSLSPQLELRNVSVGKSPNGLTKVRFDLPLPEFVRVLGYDPRHLDSSVAVAFMSDVIPLLKKIQRSVDQSRVDRMVTYIEDAFTKGSFADFGEVELVTLDEPDLSRYETERTVSFPAMLKTLLVDGGHRAAANFQFAAKHPELAGAFTQSICLTVLPKDKWVAWAAQAFHDKNYLAQPVQLAKALATDTRDIHGKLTHDLASHPAIVAAGGVSDRSDRLNAGDPEFTTHGALHKLAKSFCEGRKGLDKKPIVTPLLTQATYDAKKGELFEYTAAVASTIWSGPRDESLDRSSAAFQALGVIGHALYTKATDPVARAQMIQALGAIDWKRTNVADWHGVIGQVQGSFYVLDGADYTKVKPLSWTNGTLTAEHPANGAQTYAFADVFTRGRGRHAGYVSLEDKPPVVGPSVTRQTIEATIRFVAQKIGAASYL